MKPYIHGLIALSFALCSLAVQADTTLDYQGYVMGGTSTIMLNDGNHILSAPINTTAMFDIDLTLTGSVTENDLAVTGVSINVFGNNGGSFALETNQHSYLDFSTEIVTSSDNSTCYSGSSSVNGCINVTTAGGAITGATMTLANCCIASKGALYSMAIGASGDAFSYSYAGYSYCDPCTVNVSNPTAGVWTVSPAPEIDPASAAGGLALLFGGLAVLHSQKRT